MGKQRQDPIITPLWPAHLKVGKSPHRKNWNNWTSRSTLDLLLPASSSSFFPFLRLEMGLRGAAPALRLPPRSKRGNFWRLRAGFDHFSSYGTHYNTKEAQRTASTTPWFHQFRTPVRVTSVQNSPFCCKIGRGAWIPWPYCPIIPTQPMDPYYTPATCLIKRIGKDLLKPPRWTFPR